MVARNGIEIDRIISIVCSLTEDLTVANPATALRLDRFGEVPLFCVQEAAVEGQMASLVRMLMTYDASRPERPQPVLPERRRAPAPRSGSGLTSVAAAGRGWPDRVPPRHTAGSSVTPATLAQLAERVTCNLEVVGSNPTGGSFARSRSLTMEGDYWYISVRSCGPDLRGDSRVAKGGRL